MLREAQVRTLHVYFVMKTNYIHFVRNRVRRISSTNFNIWKRVQFVSVQNRISICSNQVECQPCIVRYNAYKLWYNRRTYEKRTSMPVPKVKVYTLIIRHYRTGNKMLYLFSFSQFNLILILSPTIIFVTWLLLLFFLLVCCCNREKNIYNKKKKKISTEI